MTTTSSLDWLIPVETPASLPVFAVRDGVLFPDGSTCLSVGSPQSLRALEEALQTQHRLILVVAQRNDREDGPGPADLYQMGCVARLVQVALARGVREVVLSGVSRARISEVVLDGGYLRATISDVAEPLDSMPPTNAAVVCMLRDLACTMLRKLRRHSRQEARDFVQGLAGPGRLADLIISMRELPVSEQQRLLEELDVRARLAFVMRT